MSKLYEFKGEKLRLRQLMKFSVVSLACLESRLKCEWDVEDAVTIESGCKKGNTVSAASVNADIRKKLISDKKKIADVGMFAQCTRRINSK